MWLNQDSLARSLTHATSTPEVPSTYIHTFPSPESPKNILLLIRERIAKNNFVLPCVINASRSIKSIIIMSCVSLLYFCARKQKTSMGEIPQHAKHTPTTPLHDSGTHSAHFTSYIHLFWIMQITVSDMIK